MAELYEPRWESLRKHQTAQWFRNAKFGLYTHWGVYSVPAFGSNGSWYPYNMYRPGTEQYEHHVKTYGGPEKFGYKDFIPCFTGEKFDPDEWAELFKRSGARFAGPVGEHHDGFCMWDTRYSEWSAARMGPKRDVVGELERAIRGQQMKYMVALHHAENWWFYPHWRKEYDTADPRYAGLYGQPHDVDGPPPAPPGQDPFFYQARPSRKFLQTWRDKIIEVIDNYQPDLLWFDFGLGAVPEQYKQEFMAYYYNKEAQWGRQVVVTYKYHDLPPNVAVVDVELGREDSLTYHEWITDSTVDNGEGWGYLSDTGYKSVTQMVQYLVDNVSKNGYLLLNVGPKPDGTIPQEARDILKGMGQWLAVNGEAIYNTAVWHIGGEGPTKLAKAGYFGEAKLPRYTGQDIRFTVNGEALYAICLGWPGNSLTIRSAKALYPDEIASVTMLGDGRPLQWKLTGEGLEVQTPPRKGEHAFVFKIARKRLPNP